MIVSNSLVPGDQKQRSVGSDLGPSCLQRSLAYVKVSGVIKNVIDIL